MEIKIWFQFCFAIQINLCNLTAIQQDCSEIAEIALWLLRLHSKKSSLTYIYSCSFQGYSGRLHHVCTLIVEIAVWLQFCFAIQINLCNLTAIQEDCSRIAEIAVGLLRLQLDCWDCKVSATYIYGWSSHRVSGRLRDIGLQFCFAIQINLCIPTAIQEDCSLIAEIALWLWRLQLDCWDCKVSATYIYSWSSHRVLGRLRYIGLQFCFAIQINLCNPTAIQEDCSQIAEIALWLLRLHSK